METNIDNHLESSAEINNIKTEFGNDVESISKFTQRSTTRQESEIEKQTDKIIDLVVTGGFTDNISIYCIKYRYPELSFRYVIKQYIYEAKQNNENLFNFPFENVIKYDPKIITETHNHKEFSKYTHNNIYSYLDYLRPILLHPKKPYSEYAKNVAKYIRNKGYTIIGMRWRYPFISINKKDSFSLISLSTSMEKIEKYLLRNNKFVLMFDDWSFVEMFTIMFHDLLVNKRVILLQKIDVNDIHDLYYISKHCYNIAYTGCSRFYRIIERLFLTYV